MHGPFFARLPNGLRRPKQPAVGTDLAGQVEAVGTDVKEFQPGDEVFGTGLGAWAEYAVAREPRLVGRPTCRGRKRQRSRSPRSPPCRRCVTTATSQRAEGADQRCGGRRRHVRRSAREVAQGGRDRRLRTRTSSLCARSAPIASSTTQEDFTRGGERYDLMLDVAGSRPFRRFRRVKPDARVIAVGAPMSSRGLGPLKHLAGTRLTALGRSQKWSTSSPGSRRTWR